MDDEGVVEVIISDEVGSSSSSSSSSKKKPPQPKRRVSFSLLSRNSTKNKREAAKDTTSEEEEKPQRKGSQSSISSMNSQRSLINSTRSRFMNTKLTEGMIFNYLSRNDVYEIILNTFRKQLAFERLVKSGKHYNLIVQPSVQFPIDLKRDYCLYRMTSTDSSRIEIGRMLDFLVDMMRTLSDLALTLGCEMFEFSIQFSREIKNIQEYEAKIKELEDLSVGCKSEDRNSGNIEFKGKIEGDVELFAPDKFYNSRVLSLNLLGTVADEIIRRNNAIVNICDTGNLPRARPKKMTSFQFRLSENQDQNKSMSAGIMSFFNLSGKHQYGTALVRNIKIGIQWRSFAELKDILLNPLMRSKIILGGRFNHCASLVDRMSSDLLKIQEARKEINLLGFLKRSQKKKMMNARELRVSLQNLTEEIDEFNKCVASPGDFEGEGVPVAEFVGQGKVGKSANSYTIHSVMSMCGMVRRNKNPLYRETQEFKQEFSCELRKLQVTHEVRYAPPHENQIKSNPNVVMGSAPFKVYGFTRSLRIHDRSGTSTERIELNEMTVLVGFISAEEIVTKNNGVFHLKPSLHDVIKQSCGYSVEELDLLVVTKINLVFPDVDGEIDFNEEFPDFSFADEQKEILNGLAHICSPNVWKKSIDGDIFLKLQRNLPTITVMPSVSFVEVFGMEESPILRLGNVRDRAFMTSISIYENILSATQRKVQAILYQEEKKMKANQKEITTLANFAANNENVMGGKEGNEDEVNDEVEVEVEINEDN